MGRPNIECAREVAARVSATTVGIYMQAGSLVFIAGCLLSTVAPGDAAVEDSSPRDAIAADAPEGGSGSSRDAGIPGVDGGVADGGRPAPVALACGGALPTWAGDLPCVGSPCAIVVSEIVDVSPSWENTPSVAVGGDAVPSIFFGTNSGGLGGGAGHIARREGGAWTTTNTPPGIVNGSLVFGDGGCGYVWAQGLFDDAGLYALSGTHFGLLHASTLTQIGAGRLVLDATGQLHAIGNSYGLFVATVGPAWTERPIAGDTTTAVFPGAIGVGPDGTEHVAWLDQTTTELAFYQRGDAVEPLFAPGTFSPYAAGVGPSIELAVSGVGGGDPRLLFADHAGSRSSARALDF